jgi:hypothetical protein
MFFSKVKIIVMVYDVIPAMLARVILRAAHVGINNRIVDYFAIGIMAFELVIGVSVRNFNSACASFHW